MLSFPLLAPTAHGDQWGRGGPTGSGLPGRASTAGTSTVELSERLTGGGMLSNECVWMSPLPTAHTAVGPAWTDLAGLVV